jgi:hypothetical protein
VMPIVIAWRLPFHFGSETHCLQHDAVRGRQNLTEGWQVCRELGTLAVAARSAPRKGEIDRDHPAFVMNPENSDSTSPK